MLEEFENFETYKNKGKSSEKMFLSIHYIRIYSWLFLFVIEHSYVLLVLHKTLVAKNDLHNFVAKQFLRYDRIRKREETINSGDQ